MYTSVLPSIYIDKHRRTAAELTLQKVVGRKCCRVISSSKFVYYFRHRLCQLFSPSYSCRPLSFLSSSCLLLVLLSSSPRPPLVLLSSSSLPSLVLLLSSSRLPLARVRRTNYDLEIQNELEMRAWGHPNLVKSGFWKLLGSLGALWDHLGQSWGHRVRLGDHLWTTNGRKRSQKGAQREPKAPRRSQLDPKSSPNRTRMVRKTGADDGVTPRSILE